MTRFVGFGHPTMIHLLKTGPKTIFVDCTFKVVPYGFYQLLIIMIYEPGTELYLPVFFVLLQGKDYDSYYIGLGLAYTATDERMEVVSISSDFEKALMNALKDRYSSDRVTYQIGCLFHWKQCLRRKLLSLDVPKRLISVLMNKTGLINICPSFPILNRNLMSRNTVPKWTSSGYILRKRGWNRMIHAAGMCTTCWMIQMHVTFLSTGRITHLKGMSIDSNYLHTKFLLSEIFVQLIIIC